jgi:hypothetical protein
MKEEIKKELNNKKMPEGKAFNSEHFIREVEKVRHIITENFRSKELNVREDRG